jgi:hypothetical protein
MDFLQCPHHGAKKIRTVSSAIESVLASFGVILRDSLKKLLTDEKEDLICAMGVDIIRLGNDMGDEP